MASGASDRGHVRSWALRRVRGSGDTQCAGGRPAARPPGNVQYGCGSCHVIPGIRQAVGTVGPPLGGFAGRAYIAGEIPNRANNLIKSIRTPQEVDPGTAMLDLGVDEQSARDMAAYLYTRP